MKFNTEGLRRRMRDQQGKFASKGKLLSSAPIRIPAQTEDLDKENADPNTSSMPTSVTKKKRAPPPLTISVTLSEEGDDDNDDFGRERSNRDELFGDDLAKDNAVDDSISQNMSVWAMMEHYQDFTSGGSGLDGGNMRLNSSTGTSDARTVEAVKKSVPMISLAASDRDGHDGDHFHGDDFDSSSVEPIRTPSRIHWLEDENGELIQNSYYSIEGLSQMVATVSSNGSAKDENDDDAAELHFDVKDALSQPSDSGNNFRRDSSIDDGECHVSAHSTNPNLDELYQGQPTPARVRSEWNEESGEDDLSSHPLSLLHDSMIRSTHEPSVKFAEQESITEAAAASSEDESFMVSSRQQENDTQLSIASLHESNLDLEELQGGSVSTEQALMTVPTSDPVHRSETLVPHEQTQQEGNLQYLGRIEELERSLQAQRNNTECVQNRLKVRVVELEQALKVTAATPRGTVIQENPLKTLLDRNQTLVKEVRFADQTCVELSSTITALQSQNNVLQQKTINLEQEVDFFRGMYESKEDANTRLCREQEAKIELLTTELRLANEQLRRNEREEEALRHILHEVVQPDEEGEMGLSLATTIVSETDSRDISIECSDIPPSRSSIHLAKALQKQVKLLTEKAKQAQEIESDKLEFQRLRAENESMKSELHRIRNERPHQPEDHSVHTDASRELSQSLSEIDFLGCQLAKVQEKLDRAQKDLDNERLRSETLGTHLRRGAETYTLLLDPLERRLLEITKSSPSTNADQKLFFLEKDFAHVKSTINAVKQEAERLLSQSKTDIHHTLRMGDDKQLINMVNSTMVRMRQRYMRLELEVDEVVSNFSEKIEALTQTVSFLRSNLVFDLETVSPEEETPGDLPNQRFENNNGTVMINATIESNRSMDDEDELYQLMEEARSPREAVDTSSDFDDVSRLLCDDFTLESVIRTGSVESYVSNPERWKEPLEAAIKECQRVRECSSKLKEQIESQKHTIEVLERENGRLSLNASRRKEENNLVDRALSEAKEQINELLCKVQEFEKEKEAQNLLRDEWESERLDIQLANKNLCEELNLVRDQKSELESRLQHLDAQIVDIRHELDFATRSCKEYKRRSDEQNLQLSTIEQQVEKRARQEVNEIRCALQVAEQQVADANRSKEEALSKLAQETSLKSTLEAKVSCLHQTNAQLVSDAEDQDLETQFAREEFRKERAELKTLLSQKETEAIALKESLVSCKTMIQSQSKEKDSLVERMQSETSDFLSHLKSLKTLRMEFCRMLSDLGFDWATPSDILDAETSLSTDAFASSTVEIEAWASFLWNLGDEIKVLHKTRSELQEVKSEICAMDVELTNNRLREADWMQQLDNEKVQNEKLWSLLRQAEQEMERSTVQIHEMSASMTILQQREHNASSKVESLEAELSQVKIDTQKTSIEQNNEFQKMKSDLSETSSSLAKSELLLTEKMSQLEVAQAELVEISGLMRSMETEAISNKATVDKLENKCTRLRDYIRKLTTKCEEWEQSYDRQARTVEKLQEKNARIRDKASDIANRYRKLAGDAKHSTKKHHEDRMKWTDERSNLREVHMTLEQELELITKELSIPLEAAFDHGVIR